MTDVIFNPEDEDALIEGYLLHLRKARKKHRLSAVHSGVWDFWVGYPAALLQAMVAATVFGTLLDSDNVKLKWAAIALSLISAALVALDAREGFRARAAKHSAAERLLKSVQQELEDERLQVQGAKADPEMLAQAMTRVRRLRDRWTEIEAQAPVFWRKVDELVETTFNPQERRDLVSGATA